MGADRSNGAPIRRGQGLRLSVTPADTAAADSDAASSPPTPIRRGHGLTLSTAGVGEAPSVAQAAPDAADVQVVARRVRLASGQVHVLEAGSGRPLLLVHGWGASARYWLPTLVALGSQRRVIAVDLPGFGASPALAVPATIARQATVLRELTDALELDIFDLAGHSFGASVAAVLAAQCPRVRRLALVSFGVLADPVAREVLGAVQQSAMLVLGLWQPVLNITHPLRAWSAPLVGVLMNLPPTPALMAAWFMEQAPADERLLREGVADMAAMDLRAHLACLASVGDPAVTRALASLAVPTLIVSGRGDRVVAPDTAQAAVRLVRDAQLQLIDSCGHVPMFEQPAQLHARLAAFLG